MQTIENQNSKIELLRPRVEAETGMKFSGKNFTRLCAAVEKVLSQKSRSLEKELDNILTNATHQSAFIEHLTAELTIGETFFFRNENHFRALRVHVVPAILKANADQGEIRIWTAGCSTGEEPYSIAILLDQILSDADHQQPNVNLGNWKAHILATDLNSEFIERARAARYREWSFRQTDIHNNRKYFSREDKEYCLVPHVRKMVRFAYLNLVKDVYPSPLTGTLGLDLILFRNVAIYLRPDVIKAIIQRFHRALRPGGWLLLGETEVTAAPREGFDVQRFGEATLFRKIVERGPISDDALPMPAPALAALLEKQPGGAADQSPLPEWVPLPKAAKVAARVETTAVADQIHRFLQQQNFAEAERTIDRILVTKDRATARLQYVRGLLACAQVGLARKMLEKCLEEESLLIEAHLLKATFAEEDGRLAEAEQAFRRALFVDRKSAIAHFHLALVQKQLGNIDAARRSLKNAGELAGDKDVHEEVPHGDGVCYGRLREMIDGILEIVDCQMPISDCNEKNRKLQNAH